MRVVLDGHTLPWSANSPYSYFYDPGATESVFVTAADITQLGMVYLTTNYQMLVGQPNIYGQDPNMPDDHYHAGFSVERQYD